MANEIKYTEVKSISGKPLADIKARNLYYYDCETINITSKDCFITENNSDGTCTITGFLPNKFKELYPNLVDENDIIQKVVIPVRIRGYVANKINFKNNSTTNYTNFLNVKELIMHNNIIEFTTNTFIDNVNNLNNEILTSIQLSKNLKEIPDRAFYNCTNLSNVILPESITYIGNSAFAGCTNLFTNCNLTIPDNCKTIQSFAFAGTNVMYICSIDELYETNIASSVKSSNIKYISKCLYLNHSQSISNGMFSECFDLKDVTIPNGIKYVSKSAFNNCSLKNITINHPKGGYINNLTIPSSVLDLNLYNYEYVNDNGTDVITKIDISNETKIENGNEILEYDIKADVFHVEPNSYAEQWCKNNNKNYEYVYNLDNDYFNYLQEIAKYYDGELVIPTPVLDFTFLLNDSGESYYLHSYKGNDKELIIPYKYNDKPVTIIANLNGTGVSGLSGVEKIILPNTITHIGPYSFKDCTSLNEIKLPSSIINIYEGAFDNCTSLNEIKLPSSVRYILASFDNDNDKLKIYLPNEYFEYGNNINHFSLSSNNKFTCYVEHESKAEEYCKSVNQNYMLTNVKPIYLNNFNNSFSIKIPWSTKTNRVYNIENENENPDYYLVGKINLDLSNYIIYTCDNSTVNALYNQIEECILTEWITVGTSDNRFNLKISLDGNIYVSETNSTSGESCAITFIPKINNDLIDWIN